MLPRLRTLYHHHRQTTLLPFRAQLRSQSTTTPSQSRITRLESRIPSFLRRYTTPLRTAPVSHITAFLLLHEITAIVPLLSLTAAFHYFDWLPPFLAEGVLVKEGVERFGRYLRKKGWVVDEGGLGADAQEGRVQGKSGKWWGRGEGGVRLVVELATAWAVTKVLLPLRLVVSVWGTPWFARLAVLPVTGLIKRGWGRVGGRSAGSPVAGTNAVGGGIVKKVK